MKLVCTFTELIWNLWKEEYLNIFVQIFQHPGRGIDVRRRKIWDMYGPETHLEVLCKCMSVLLICTFIHLFIVSGCIDARVRKHTGYTQLSKGSHGFVMLLPISLGGEVSCKGRKIWEKILYCTLAYLQLACFSAENHWHYFLLYVQTCSLACLCKCMKQAFFLPDDQY